MARKRGLMVLGLALALALGGMGEAEGQKRLQLGSWDPGSGWYVYAATMASIINKAKLGFQVDALAKGGGIGNPINVGEGKYDMGVTFSLANAWAYQGKIAYKKAYRNLRGLIGGMDEYYLAIITTNPKVSKIADIGEKRLPIHLITAPRGGLGQWATRAMLDAHGVTEENIKRWGGTVTHTGFKVIVSRIKDGQADFFSHTVNPGHPSLTEIALSRKVRFLGVEEAVRDQLVGLGFLKATMPPKTFPGQEEPLPTFAFTSALVANAAMSEEVAYKVVKVLLDNLGDLRAGHKGLRDFDPAKTGWQEAHMGAPVHTGATRYFKERGWLR